MPLPLFDESGWLPEGIYEVTWEEVEEAFGRFRVNERRPTLYNKLRAYEGELVVWKAATSLYLDGSFISSKPSPGDIDVVLCLREDFALRGAEWSPYEQNLVSKSYARRYYEIDLWPAIGEESALARARAFMNKKPPEVGRKGVVKVKL